MEIVKKAGFRSDSICRVEVYLRLIFCTCTFETVKTCMSLFLLLKNLFFQVVTVLVKSCFLIHISCTLETFHKSSVTRFLIVYYVSQEYFLNKFLEVIDPFVTEIWCFMVFTEDF